MVKNLPAKQEMWVLYLGQKDPWRSKWQPTLVFLPGKSYGQRSLVGYSPQGCKESDMTERVHAKGIGGLPWWLSDKEPTCQCRRHKFDPWVRKIPWWRKWQPTPVFLPGESHEQRSLTGYSPQGRRRVRYDLVTKNTKGVGRLKKMWVFPVGVDANSWFYRNS